MALMSVPLRLWKPLLVERCWFGTLGAVGATIAIVLCSVDGLEQWVTSCAVGNGVLVVGTVGVSLKLEQPYRVLLTEVAYFVLNSNRTDNN